MSKFLQSLGVPLHKIGQMVILRRLICRQLASAGRICSDKLYLALENLNFSILNDVMHKKTDGAPDKAEEIADKVLNNLFQLYKQHIVAK